MGKDTNILLALQYRLWKDDLAYSTVGMNLAHYYCCWQNFVSDKDLVWTVIWKAAAVKWIGVDLGIKAHFPIVITRPTDPCSVLSEVKLPKVTFWQLLPGPFNSWFTMTKDLIEEGSSVKHHSSSCQHKRGWNGHSHSIASQDIAPLNQLNHCL